MNIRRRNFLGASVFLLAIAALCVLVFTRGKSEGFQRHREGHSESESPNLVLQEVASREASRSQESTREVGKRYSQVQSRAQAEALILMATRARDHTLLDQLSSDPDVARFIDRATINKLVLEEAKRDAEVTLARRGLKETPNTADGLLDVLGRASNSPRERLEAVRQLRAASFSAEDVTKLSELYLSSDPVQKKLLLEVAQQAPGEALAAFLLNLAQSPGNADERIQALRALQIRMPTDASLDALEQMLVQEPDARVRAAALGSIGANTSDRAAGIVVGQLSSSVPELRARAVTEIRLTDQARQMVAALAQADPESQVRVAALKRLGGSSDASFVDVLLSAAARDAAREVRIAALDSLSSVTPTDVGEIERVSSRLNSLLGQERDPRVGESLARTIAALEVLRRVGESKSEKK